MDTVAWLISPEGKLSLGFEDMDEQTVKNIAKPVRVYRVRASTRENLGQDAIGDSLPLPDKPSIVVLPFDDMSGDAGDPLVPMLVVVTGFVTTPGRPAFKGRAATGFDTSSTSMSPAPRTSPRCS